MRPLRALCGTAALALTLPVLSPGQAAAAVPTISVYLQNYATGLNAADSGGTVVAHNPKGTEDHQQWTPVAVGGGYRLQNADESGTCLGRNGTAAVTTACGADGTTWTITAATDSTYTVSVPGTSQYLTTSSSDSAAVQLGSSGDLARWYLTPTAYATTPASADTRTLDQVTFLTSHNAFANGADGNFASFPVNLFPNQNYGISRQLSDGVRGFMLDAYTVSGRAVLCHNSCDGVGSPVPLATDLQRMVDFLKVNPGQFVTVFLEDYASSDVLKSSLASVNGLYDVLYRPDQEGVATNGWPTMADLAARGKQLLIFSDRTRTSDSANGWTTRDSFGVMYQREWTVENYWSMGGGIGDSDWSCYSRWGTGRPLTTDSSAFHPLFVMNHFRDYTITATTTTDNGKLLNRAQNFCTPAARKKPTYLAVDRYELGSPTPLSTVNTLNTYILTPGQ
ncbi:RICIN domain-containing protein [Streptomyces sp. NBC_00140]|uniref:RICIN domain-containing protein n=1 Tax=Streptomyces sp. NBC_00140 TaxID=2975664 RepID=UPI00224F2AE3|nr:RICIN domain-containing protein [Streptomyces sp. NBC_00140]MCX5335897.1 RICIN domain-containing protein [Streptomyces sp. NBC_00140]